MPDTDDTIVTFGGRRYTGRRGQPTKLTPERKDRIVSYLITGVSAEVAARACNISPATHYTWMNRGKHRGPDEPRHTRADQIYVEYHDECTRARAEAEIRLAGYVMAAAPTEWRAALAMLSSIAPERWAKNRLEITGAQGAPIDVRAVPSQPLDPAAVDAMTAVLERANLVPAEPTALEAPSGNGSNG